MIAPRGHDLDLFLARVELQFGLAEMHGTAGLEVGLAHPHLVDEGAIRRAQIVEDVTRVLLDDAAVIARHRVVSEDDVVVVHRAEANGALVEAALDRPAVLLEDQLAAAQVQRRAATAIVDLGRGDEVRELLGLCEPIVAVSEDRPHRTIAVGWRITASSPLQPFEIEIANPFGC